MCFLTWFSQKCVPTPSSSVVCSWLNRSEVLLWQETESVDFCQCFKSLPVRKFLLAPGNLPAELCHFSVLRSLVYKQVWEPCTVTSRASDMTCWSEGTGSFVGPGEDCSWAAYHKEPSQAQASPIDSSKWVICSVVEALCGRWVGWVIGILFVELLFIPPLFGLRNKRWFFFEILVWCQICLASLGNGHIWRKEKSGFPRRGPLFPETVVSRDPEVCRCAPSLSGCLWGASWCLAPERKLGWLEGSLSSSPRPPLCSFTLPHSPKGFMIVTLDVKTHYGFWSWLL